MKTSDVRETESEVFVCGNEEGNNRYPFTVDRLPLVTSHDKCFRIPGEKDEGQVVGSLKGLERA
jgi:hypothetical protein